MIAVPVIAEIAVCRKTAKITVKNFPVYNHVQGRYETSQTENSKNQLGLSHHC